MFLNIEERGRNGRATRRNSWLDQQTGPMPNQASSPFVLVISLSLPVNFALAVVLGRDLYDTFYAIRSAGVFS